MTLGSEPLGDEHAAADRCHVVDLGQLQRGIEVLPRPFLVPEDPERDDDHVHVAVGIERGRDGLLVGVPFSHIAVHLGDLQPLSVQGRRGSGPALAGASREGHVHTLTWLGQLEDRGEGDLGGATQHQDPLQVADGVLHSSNLLARSDMNTPSGSASCLISRHCSSRGYIFLIVAAVIRESLAR